ncbi:MAG: DUF4252 domain-containing protein [Bacteroidales bacterium]|nr:DUF4252 domain-containing protein [Bacteroidales bacterium]MBR5671377.1 DUF4252 domain-containing protein [Bacteroidales bacterium]
MKKIILTAILAVLSVSAFAQTGKSLYEKYSDYEGVEAVYISPAMFKLIGKLTIDMGEENLDIARLVRSIKGMYILNMPSSSPASRLAGEVSNMIRRGNYELLMEAKDSGNRMQMFTNGDDNIIRSFVMLNTDGDETSFICFDGEMVREDFENVVRDAM